MRSPMVNGGNFNMVLRKQERSRDISLGFVWMSSLETLDRLQLLDLPLV